jgi:hypothetical protein
MNHVLEGKSLYWIIPTAIGRMAIGWFSAPIIYNYILEQLNN